MKKNSNYSQEHLNERGIWICRACHSAIHGMYDNFTLAEHYNTLELLNESEIVRKWVRYIGKRRLTSHTSDSRVKKKKNKVAMLEIEHGKRASSGGKGKKRKGKKGKGKGKGEGGLLMTQKYI